MPRAAVQARLPQLLTNVNAGLSCCMSCDRTINLCQQRSYVRGRFVNDAGFIVSRIICQSDVVDLNDGSFATGVPTHAVHCGLYIRPTDIELEHLDCLSGFSIGSSHGW